MKLIQPFKTEVNLITGALASADYIIQRRLSDMATMYADRDEAERILAQEGGRLIYEVQGVELEASARLYTRVQAPSTICLATWSPGQAGLAGQGAD